MTGIEIVDKLSAAQDELGSIMEFAEKNGNWELENIMIQIDLLLAEAVDNVL